MTVALYQGGNAEEVRFSCHPTEFELILFGSNGGKRFNGIHGFGGSIPPRNKLHPQFQP
jgi:hypothetical protein